MKNIIFSGSSDESDENIIKEPKNENEDNDPIIIYNSPTHNRRKRVRHPVAEPNEIVTYQYSGQSSATQSPERQTSPRKRRRRKYFPEAENGGTAGEKTKEAGGETHKEEFHESEPQTDKINEEECNENDEKQNIDDNQEKSPQKQRYLRKNKRKSIDTEEVTFAQTDSQMDEDQNPPKRIKIDENIDIAKQSSEHLNTDTSNTEKYEEDTQENEISQGSKDDDLITYYITREKSIHILGKQYEFQISDGQKVLYSSKFKAKNNVMPISCKEKCHAKDSENIVAYIVSGNSSCDFTLRKKSQTGYELLTVRFFPLERIRIKTRKCIVTFFTQDDSGQTKILRLLSKTPERAQNGDLRFNFGHKPYIQSLKNLLLYDCIDKVPVVRIRKLPNDSIEADAKSNIEPLHLFALVIADCLCNLTSF